MLAALETYEADFFLCVPCVECSSWKSHEMSGIFLFLTRDLHIFLQEKISHDSQHTMEVKMGRSHTRENHTSFDHGSYEKDKKKE